MQPCLHLGCGCTAGPEAHTSPCASLTSHRLSLGHTLGSSYKAGADSATRYESLRVVHDFCTSFDPAEYKASALTRWAHVCC